MPAPVISLAPLNAADHTQALQQVYRATPRYWRLYGLDAPPNGQSARDLHEAAETPGRYLLGIIRRIEAEPVTESPPRGELIGMTDFRLHFPQAGTAYVGLVLVAEPWQRQGVGAQAWRLLAPWLAQTAGIDTARLGVEQFNPGALLFFQALGFALTGASRRVDAGGKPVRLLEMEQTLTSIIQ